jgi:hypothetical protein
MPSDRGGHHAAGRPERDSPVASNISEKDATMNYTKPEAAVLGEAAHVIDFFDLKLPEGNLRWAFIAFSAQSCV